MAFSTELLCHVRSTVQLHMFCLVSCTTAAAGDAGQSAQSKASTAALFLFIPIARGASRPGQRDADGRCRELGSGSLIGFPPSGSRKQSSIYVLKSIETYIHYDAIKRRRRVFSGLFCPFENFILPSLVVVLYRVTTLAAAKFQVAMPQ